MLPLRINIPIKPVGANKQTFKAKAYAYLFPFGACTVNLKVNFSNISLIEFADIIQNLKRASIVTVIDDKTTDMGNFSKFSLSIAKQVAGSLFQSDRMVVPFEPHAMIFVRKMAPPDVPSNLF